MTFGCGPVQASCGRLGRPSASARMSEPGSLVRVAAPATVSSISSPARAENGRVYVRLKSDDEIEEYYRSFEIPFKATDA